MADKCTVLKDKWRNCYNSPYIPEWSPIPLISCSSVYCSCLSGEYRERPADNKSSCVCSAAYPASLFHPSCSQVRRQRAFSPNTGACVCCMLDFSGMCLSCVRLWESERVGTANVKLTMLLCVFQIRKLSLAVRESWLPNVSSSNISASQLVMPKIFYYRNMLKSFIV